jgi:ectoine hydroxylase-related dioxygenase (phytanoyl-CoA dioxygenase family)
MPVKDADPRQMTSIGSMDRGPPPYDAGMITAPPPCRPSLSRAECDRYHREGWLGPYRALEPEAMSAFARAVDSDLLTTDGPNPKERTHCRHLDRRFVYDLAAHEQIVARIAALIGEDLLLWTSGFWIKESDGRGARTPWHQDINYWPLEPQVNITAWIAIEDVDEQNAPLQLIPGSHRRMIPHVRLPSADHGFGEEAAPDQVDDRGAITCRMRAGEFIIFSERLLHGAPQNRSPRRRIGLSARYTMSCVKVFQDHAPLRFPAHRVLVVGGTDRFGFSRVGEPPSAV